MKTAVSLLAVFCSCILLHTSVAQTEETNESKSSLTQIIASNAVKVAEQLPSGILTNSRAVVGVLMEPVRRQPKPAHFKCFSERLDYIHTNLYNDYNTRIERTDQYIGRNLMSREAPIASRFRCGLYAQIAQEDSTEFAFSPDFEAEIALPNLEKTWNIIVNTADPQDLPSADPTEKRNDIRFGVSTIMKKLDLRTDVGIRVTWLPVGYAILKWAPVWNYELWQVRPSQRFFYETDDGFGEQTQLGVYRWFGKRSRLAAGGIAAGTFSESTDGLEWEQTLKVGYIRELIEETGRGKGAVDGSDMARGTWLRYTLSGSDTLITEHRVVLGHRHPLYQRWIYLDIQPGIKWRNESDWSTDPFVLFGLDFFFWGSATR